MNADATLHASHGTCPNCFAETAGNFCHQCSQETTLHPPSAREFLHEFIGHYVALEGKLWQSLWLLLCKPGRLTLEYIQGRRVRYVQPLRLYLTFSLIFFAVVKFTGVPAEFDEGDRVHVPAGASVEQARRASKIQIGRAGDNNETLQGIEAAAQRLHPGWGPKTARFFAQPPEVVWSQLIKAIFTYAHYAMFALMPVFALLLKLLYLPSRRRFGAHLLFALHVNAFAFAILTLQILMPASLGFLQAVLMFWMIIYLPLALRRVYGGGWTTTMLRWAALMLLHLLCITLAIVAAAGSAAIA